MNLAINDQGDCPTAYMVISRKTSLACTSSMALADGCHLFPREFMMPLSDLRIRHRGDVLPRLIPNDVTDRLGSNPKDGSKIVNSFSRQISPSQLRDFCLVQFGSVHGGAEGLPNRSHGPRSHAMNASSENSNDSGLAQSEMFAETSDGHLSVKIQRPELFNVGRRHLCMSRQSSPRILSKTDSPSASADHILRIFAPRPRPQMIRSHTSWRVTRVQKNGTRWNRPLRKGIGNPMSRSQQFRSSIGSVHVELKDAISGCTSFSSSPQPAPIGLMNPLPKCGSGLMINGRKRM